MKEKGFRSAKEIAYSALFVALLIGGQYAFATIPGVEVVTLLFVSYSFSMGKERGMVAATAFSFLRQLVFGASVKTLILYLVYFNFLTLIFGILGEKSNKRGEVKLWLVTLVACACTAFFTLFDNVLTPLYYGFTAKAAKAYFISSLPFMFPQILCTGLTVGYLFLPLRKVFAPLAEKLERKHRPR